MMTILKALMAIACLLVVSSVTGSTEGDLLTSATNFEKPCQEELASICGTSNIADYEQSFQARMCLRAGRAKLGENCQAYLRDESPSIVEPCFNEINTRCSNIQPGENRILMCLMDQEYASMGEDCKTALADVVVEGGDDDASELDDAGDDDKMFWTSFWPSSQTSLLPSFDSLNSFWSPQSFTLSNVPEASLPEVLALIINRVAMEMLYAEEWITQFFQSKGMNHLRARVVSSIEVKQAASTASEDGFEDVPEWKETTISLILQIPSERAETH